VSAVLRTRPRGLTPWRMNSDSAAVVEAVRRVLEEYRAHLPLTIRQVFYRLVALEVLGKTERDYKGLCEKVNRARRGLLVPFDAIRDDGLTHKPGHDFADLEDALGYFDRLARSARFDLQADQSCRLVLWCEAAGMVPQLQRVGARYGVDVVSSGGFDSLTAKHDMACQLGQAPHEVLHIGDFDPSGVHVFSSLAEDVNALASDLGLEPVTFTRLAVTPAQIARLGLPTAPPKVTDRRAFDGAGTVQAEAIPPDELARIIGEALTSRLDLEAIAEAERQAEEWRAELQANLRGQS
jgi:hypothetical protein